MRTIVIRPTNDPWSPREWDNLGTMAYNHSRYVLGDEEIGDPVEWLINEMDIEDQLEASPRWWKLDNTEEMMDYLLGRFEKTHIFLPLYIYDHSGVTMNTTGFTCRWDSGQVGWIYVSKDKVREEYGVKRISPKLRERVLGVLKAEVETFDQYIRGEVYGFEIQDEDGEVEDSCCGFYGDDWEKNGLKSHIPEELWPQLEDVEVQYEY